jgi:hypothetical protein
MQIGFAHWKMGPAVAHFPVNFFLKKAERIDFLA